MYTHRESSDSDGNQHRHKRQRANLACEGCKRRKSKCDVVRGRSCYRCEQLGMSCSFDGADLGVVPEQARANVPLGGEVNEEPNNAWPSPSTSQSTWNKDTFRGNRDEIWFRDAADLEAFGLIQGGMGSMAEYGLIDPVSEGVISAGLAEMAYQMFKHHISGILPYGPLLSSRSRLPTHPFLRSACLFYLTRCSLEAPVFTAEQNKHLELNVCQNLLAYQRGCRPSTESILAGLILSLLSFGQLVGPAASFDFNPARMVGMAYGQLRELGHSVFIERVVGLLETGVDTLHLADMIQTARLHYCIMTRVSWTNLSRCPNNDLPTALNATHRRFTTILRQKKLSTDLDHHLMYEHASLDILMRESNALHKLERASPVSTDALQLGNQDRANAVKEMNALRSQAQRDGERLVSLSWLLCQLSYSKWWMTIRNLWFSYRIPTPLLHGSIYNEWIASLNLAAQASADMVSQCLEESWDLASFPKAIGTAVVLCYHTLSMGIAHFDSQISPSPLVLSSIIDKLPLIRARLAETSPALRLLVTRTETTLEEYKRRLKAADRVDSTASLPFNFVDFGDPFGSLQWDPMAEAGQWDWQQTWDHTEGFFLT